MDDYPLLDLFWTMFVFFMWILWFMLLFRIFEDLFRNHTMSGIRKAVWTIILVILPFLGVIIYLIVNGDSMSQRQLERAQQSQAAFRAHAGDAPGTTDELVKLAKLKSDGFITNEEYETAKSKVLL